MTTQLETQVIEAEERLRQAMLHNDVRALDELIAPDLLFTSLTGQLVTKADDLAAHRARLLQVTDIEPVRRSIQLNQGFAVVSVLMHLKGSYDGSPIDQHLRYTRVWSVEPDGSVQIVAGHMSEVRLD